MHQSGMLSNRHHPQHKEIEERALFRLAQMISIEKAGVAIGSESIRRYLQPLLDGDGTHDSLSDNRIAFAMLGRLLNPIKGPGQSLPQHAPHWLAFRRLFLRICDTPIPEDILDGGIWTERNRKAKEGQIELLKKRGIIGEFWMEPLRSLLKSCHDLLARRDREKEDQGPEVEASTGDGSDGPTALTGENGDDWVSFLQILTSIRTRLAAAEASHQGMEAVFVPAIYSMGPRFRDLDASSAQEFLAGELHGHVDEWANLLGHYLRICDKPVPKNTREQSIWTATLQDLREISQQLDLDSPLIDAEALGRWEHPWETEFAPQLAAIKLVMTERLSDYSKLSIASVKDYFVEHGTVSLEPECGALYEVVQTIDWDAVPLSEKIDESVDSTQLWLKRIMADVSPEVDFDGEYALAVRSVRGVLFDLAVEAVLGKTEPSTLSAWECEKRSIENRMLRYPYSILTDERVLFFLADGFGQQGSTFAGHLESRFKTLEDPLLKANSQHGAFILKKTMALKWLNPDLPLWLMQAPTVQAIIKPLLPSSHRCEINQIKEVTKNRSESTKSGLHGASKAPIVKKRKGQAEFGFEPIWVWNYYRRSVSANGFLEHLESALGEKKPGAEG